MSVIMTMRLKADAGKWEEVAQSQSETLQAISQAARDHGVIAHRFYGSDDEVMVVDEWPDAESFQAFFSSQEAQIGPLMQAAGVTSEPDITFWRKLETGDEVGWENA